VHATERHLSTRLARPEMTTSAAVRDSHDGTTCVHACMRAPAHAEKPACHESVQYAYHHVERHVACRSTAADQQGMGMRHSARPQDKIEASTPPVSSAPALATEASNSPSFQMSLARFAVSRMYLRALAGARWAEMMNIHPSRNIDSQKKHQRLNHRPSSTRLNGHPRTFLFVVVVQVFIAACGEKAERTCPGARHGRLSPTEKQRSLKLRKYTTYAAVRAPARPQTYMGGPPARGRRPRAAWPGARAP
jgi:hypothetical protein